MKPSLTLFAAIVAIVGSGLAGCAAQSADVIPEATPPPIPLDADFLQQSLWDDGRSEVAFYRVERARNQYGRAEGQAFTVGTYLVRHEFSPARMAKATAGDADAVSAFKYAFFYELESGSYQYKRSFVANARQADLAPLKASFTLFDWCSNAYRELAFGADGVDALYRSDDYGNSAASFEAPADAVPASLVPLVVRALAFEENDTAAFAVLADDGGAVPAMATRTGRVMVETEAGPREGERIVVRYAGEAPSLVGAQQRAAAEEVWVRGTDPARLLLSVEAASGEYAVTLVEALRSAYWEEDFWPRLDRIAARP